MVFITSLQQLKEELILLELQEKSFMLDLEGGRDKNFVWDEELRCWSSYEQFLGKMYYDIEEILEYLETEDNIVLIKC